MSQPSSTMPLGLPGFAYADLHAPHRLQDLYDVFCRDVDAAAPELWAQWADYRHDPDRLSTLDRSDLLVRMAPHVSRFVARLFGADAIVAGFADGTRDLEPLFRFKIDFVRKRALPLLKGGARVARAAADAAVVDEITRPWVHLDREWGVAMAGCALLDREVALRENGSADDTASLAAQVEALKRWCASCVHDPEYDGWVVFRFPGPVNYDQLVQVQRPRADLPQLMVGPDDHLQRRDGFSLTDDRWSTREVLSETHYCVLCHERDKDSCSKGHRDKDGTILPNPLGIALAGCPLDEKISEMHTLRQAGDPLGALCIVMVDNPMCPGTGHRICNDCMKACIYQKQDPVNIPQIETGALTDVLQLPWGVEIYGFLTRWNPLNVRRPFALPYNGRNVLVVGLGPAGYTLAHYLSNEGFGVVAIDGLKIEPLPASVTDEHGAPRPIEQWTQIYSQLDERVLAGFGGVSEYGITVRWDKNFLTLIHLTLARRARVKIYGGVRFGGTMTIDDAWAYGFDHIAVAAGAGRPTVVDMAHNLVRGVRQANDFLMALQLTGAFKRHALPNLQVRMPVVVIGGGLTGIDASTESFAYYPVQVEKTLERYETLVREMGEDAVRAGYEADEREILDEFLAHGRAIRAERERARLEGGAPDFVPLMRAWGGVTLVYRKRMSDSPAYRLNHEEVSEALAEGIFFAEHLHPRGIVADAHDQTQAVVFDGPDGPVRLPARTVLVAAGTVPNVTYEREAPGTFELDATRRFFRGFSVESGPNGPTLVPDENGFFTSYHREGRLISYYGDNHPRYAGNVVKAMASAKHGYSQVAALFQDPLDPDAQPARDAAWNHMAARLDDDLLATVVRVERLAPSVVDVLVRAPAAARHFQPGQCFRLQNFEALAPRAGGHPDGSQATPLAMEGIAVTGAWVDREAGVLSAIVRETGVSSRLAAYLTPGEPVVLMGPTGSAADIPRDEDVLLVGGGLGHAALFSIARALRAHGSRVLYFAGYRRGEDLYTRGAIETAADQVIWSTDGGAAIAPSRPQDVHVRGSVVDAMLAYAEGRLGEARVPISGVSRIIAIGSDRMMAAVAAARATVLAPHLRNGHVGIASINSPMQCMMKEICAQCLQRHVDPVTGRETFVFSCSNQHQAMDRVDFQNLSARLRQNTTLERLSDAWLNHLLATVDLQHV